MSTTKEALNLANPNSVPDMLRKVSAGDILGGLIPTANARTGLASNATQVNDLPGALLAVESPAGTNLTIVGPGATPAAGEVAVSYDADGVATLTFNAAVTAYTALQLTLPAGLGATLAADSGTCV